MLDLSHQRTDPAACRQSMTRGCGSKSEWAAGLDGLPLTLQRAKAPQGGPMHREARAESWGREKSLHMEKKIRFCVDVHTYASLKAPKPRAVALKSFLLFGLLCSLIPFKVNLAVVHLKTIPILCCLPHTRSTPFLSNSCLTSQLVLQKLSSQLPEISIQELPSGAAAHFHLGLAFVFVL